MDFYTGKPDRPIEHYGIVHHSFQASQATGMMKTFTTFFNKSLLVIEQQSDDEALQTLKELVLSKHPDADVIHDMNIAIAHIPAQNSYCIITKIYASYESYKE